MPKTMYSMRVDRDRINQHLDMRGWSWNQLWVEMVNLGWTGSQHALTHLLSPSRGDMDPRCSTVYFLTRAFGLATMEELLELYPVPAARKRRAKRSDEAKKKTARTRAAKDSRRAT